MAHFTFGIGRYISFSFRIGLPPCACRDGNNTGRTSYDRPKEKKENVLDAYTNKSSTARTDRDRPEADKDTDRIMKVSADLLTAPKCDLEPLQGSRPSPNGYMLRDPCGMYPGIRRDRMPYPPPPRRAFPPFHVNTQSKSTYRSPYHFIPQQAASQTAPHTHPPSQNNEPYDNSPTLVLQLSPSQPSRDYLWENAKPVKHLVAEHGSPSNCVFLAIPPEVRIMVYELLLISTATINVHNLTGPQRSVMVGNGPQANGINAAILRTSRSIYREAIQTLYGKNDFYFNAPFDIRDFRFHDMTSHGAFGLEAAPCSRPDMLQTVTLRLGSAGVLLLRIPGDPVNRELLWSGWSSFFEPTDRVYSSTNLPALQNLCLDFSDWELDDGQASELDVNRFVPKLRGSNGLRKLEIKGVVHRQNLRDFRRLLVKPGGTFRARDSHDQPVPNFFGRVDLPVNAGMQPSTRRE